MHSALLHRSGTVCVSSRYVKEQADKHRTMRVKWLEYPVAVRIILVIYSIGFLGGTHSHMTGIWYNGFFAQKAPLLFNLYWDSLTLFDPLTVLLLWTRPRAGVGLAVGIMLTDIPVNAYSYASGYFGPPVPGMITTWLFTQSLFATFVFVTAPVVLEKLRQPVKGLVKN